MMNFGILPRVMPAVSIQFLIVCALLIAAFHIMRRAREAAQLKPLLLLILLAAAQAALVSMRWDFGVTMLIPLQVSMSCLLPGLCWISMKRLHLPGETLFGHADAIHLFPVAAAGAAWLLAPELTDVIIAATYAVYGFACLRLAMRGSNALTEVSLQGVLDVHKALWLVTFALFGSALVDAAVIMNFAAGGGLHAPLLIGIGNLIWLVALAYFTLVAAGALPPEAMAKANLKAEPETANSTVDSERILAIVKTKLVDDQLFKDADLTLTRLARRCGVPARHISRAVKEVHHQNVSQFVNAVRIAEACRLLATTQDPITSIIYDCGFQTKSNFNREFLRVTGKTPSLWRKEKGWSTAAPAR